MMKCGEMSQRPTKIFNILLMVQKSGDSPVELGSLSYYLQGFSTIPGGAGFLPSTVGYQTWWFGKGTPFKYDRFWYLY